MSQWASSFKSKQERAIEALDEEIKDWEEKAKIYEKEILAGAPARDFGGVRALKKDLEIALNEKGKAQRKRTKLTDQVSGRNK